MDGVNRGYHEPELQKMAPFLRERCERGKYGLKYINMEKTKIEIPWPTVSRQQEEVPESFDMFSEWAYLSFRKRGNRGEQQENETKSAQKHRFRNALARADGLRIVKELSTDTSRVYEFADTKGDREHRDNGNNRTPVNKTMPLPANFPTEITYPYIPPIDDLSDSSEHTVVGGINDYYCDSPMTVTASPAEPYGYQYQANGIQHGFETNEVSMQDDRQPSFNTLIRELLDEPPPEMESDDNSIYQPAPANLTFAVPQPLPDAVVPVHPQYNTPQPNNRMQTVRQESHVQVKISFRGEDVLQTQVTNGVGFRLYSGNNIPDMSRLLDSSQRKQLEALTRYRPEFLYGPDSIQQIQIPFPTITGFQSERTYKIIDNMDRGVVFYTYIPPPNETPYPNAGIPDVYSIRLCQSRVFPYETNVQDRQVLEQDGLKRLEMMKIFDASEFLHQVQKWSDNTGQQLPQPSPHIHLAVGQKPKTKDINLVFITLTVTKAKNLLIKKLEDQIEEIQISDRNSMDNAAQVHKDRITDTIRVGDELFQRKVQGYV